ncbi:MAG: hypothetical protein ACOC44_07340 [Promethearchaeia archaeon]
MSEEAATKTYIIDVKDLSFQKEEIVVDLIRFLSEQLPQVQITRERNELTCEVPLDFSKRSLRLRIRKFLYKRDLKDDFRPISLNHPEKDGYMVKERKVIEFTYY